MRESLDKHGQLAVVVVGFFATVQLTATGSGVDAASSARLALTLALALALAVRYWWVVLLLPWPFHWFRLVLILLAWSTLPFTATRTTDARHWVLALAMLSAVGFVTEVFNGLTGQWRIGSEAMMRSLKRDHVTGAAASALVAAILVPVSKRFTSPALERLVLVMVVADWARLVVMIRRHQRLLAEERPA
jgi:hypothetical protein